LQASSSPIPRIPIWPIDSIKVALRKLEKGRVLTIRGREWSFQVFLIPGKDFVLLNSSLAKV